MRKLKKVFLFIKEHNNQSSTISNSTKSNQSMSSIMTFLQSINNIKSGECLGKCGNMVTEEDKDHAMCDSCWDKAFVKMPKARVTFAGDNTETLLKPPPNEIHIYNINDPPSSVSSVSSEEDEPVLRKSVNRWVPPHKRVQAPGPVKLTRKNFNPYLGPREKYGRGHRLRDGDSSDEEYDPSLQCDEEFRDGDDRMGHNGEGYKPMCVMSEEPSYPTDADLLRRKHENQQTIKFHQDPTILSQVIPEGCVMYGGRIRKERFFDSYGDEV